MRDLRERLSAATEQSSGAMAPASTGAGGTGAGRSQHGSAGGARPQTPSAFSSLYSTYSSSLALPAHVARTLAPNKAAIEPVWAIAVCSLLSTMLLLAVVTAHAIFLVVPMHEYLAIGDGLGLKIGSVAGATEPIFSQKRATENWLFCQFALVLARSQTPLKNKIHAELQMSTISKYYIVITYNITELSEPIFTVYP